MSKEVRIRKNNDILSVAGYGVIVFILWALIKGIIYIRYFIPNSAQASEGVYSLTYIVISGIVLIFSLLTGWYARKIGRNDKRPSMLLLILSGILLLFAFYCIIADLILTIIDKTFSVVSIVSIISDVLFFLVVLQMFVSTIILRKIRTNQEEADNER